MVKGQSLSHKEPDKLVVEALQVRYVLATGIERAVSKHKMQEHLMLLVRDAGAGKCSALDPVNPALEHLVSPVVSVKVSRGYSELEKCGMSGILSLMLMNRV